jgi:transcription termination factor Rho
MTDAAPFDPSILDGKSKDELTAIATTLGPKPSARFKKADLIAHILDLVGAPAVNATAGGAGGAEARSGERHGADADPSDDATTTGADERAPSAVPATPSTGEVTPFGAVGSRASMSAAGRAGASGRSGASRPGRSGRSEVVGEAEGVATGSESGGRSDGGSDRGATQRNDSAQHADRGDGNDRSSTANDRGVIQRTDNAKRGGGGGGGGGGNDRGANQRNDTTKRTDNGDNGEPSDREASQRQEGDRAGSGGGSDRAGNQRNGGGSGGGSERNGGGNGSGNEGNRPGQVEAAGPGNQADPPRPGDGDPDEDGNRRRRRRGRDRDREGAEQAQPEPITVEGLVDLRHEGYGFLRVNGFLPSRGDAYISVKQTRQFGLRTGDLVGGKARPANRNEKNPALLQVERVNGHPSHSQPSRRTFEDLTPLFPDERLHLELAGDPANTTVRIIDLVAPIGKGQRGLIVSPPKAGKTTIVKHVVRSIETNHPEVELMVLLVDERPEEVTDMKRWLLRGTVAASTFDRPADEHISVAELVIERAKRLVEDGKDVVVVLDGITRLARAYNLAAPATGRIMAGGIDTGALYPPKKFFGAARNAEEGGSLTILATALVETNTRMDEVIFEEFKGTGNMELKLDRKLAERRIFPAIDVDASSTRHEELLFDRHQLAQVWKLRRVLGAIRDESGSSASGVEMLTDRLAAFKTNDAFLAEVAKTTAG